MSRVGLKEINIPENVKVSLQDAKFIAEGPLGKLESGIHNTIDVKIDGNIIKVSPKNDDKETKSFWGLQRNLVNNKRLK